MLPTAKPYILLLALTITPPSYSASSWGNWLTYSFGTGLCFFFSYQAYKTSVTRGRCAQDFYTYTTELQQIQLQEPEKVEDIVSTTQQFRKQLTNARATYHNKQNINLLLCDTESSWPTERQDRPASSQEVREPLIKKATDRHKGQDRTASSYELRETLIKKAKDRHDMYRSSQKQYAFMSGATALVGFAVAVVFWPKIAQ